MKPTRAAVFGAAAFLSGALIYKGCISETKKTPEVSRRGNYFFKEDFDYLYNVSYQVTNTVTLEEKVDGDDDYEKMWFGSGTLLKDLQTGDYYIFTAEHLTSDGTYKDKQGKRIKIVKEKITVDTYEATIIKENEKDDLALLKLSGSPGQYFTGKIAQTLEPGDYVLGIGFPDGKKKSFATMITKTTDNSTFLNIFIIGGNSGGGVYLINNSELQLCGVVKKTDQITSLQKVREFFKGTPLEDEYL